MVLCPVLCCTKLTLFPNIFLECSNYTILDEFDRAQSYRGRVKCDNHLAKGWYRFQGRAGKKMPEQCVATHHCGTHAPGYLNGRHPIVAEGIVSRRVCFHWSSNCCRWSRSIRVRNCNGFYVYELGSTPACSLRYCGDADIGKGILPVLLFTFSVP